MIEHDNSVKKQVPKAQNYFASTEFSMFPNEQSFHDKQSLLIIQFFVRVTVVLFNPSPAGPGYGLLLQTV